MPSRASVLIVEDEIIIARDLEARLKSLGYDVAGIASSGAEALRLVEAAKPDLILMDVVLKGDMDGIETASVIREHVRLPVLYLTAYTDPNTLARARVTEPYGYVVKPFSERELHANIEMALYKHQAETRLRQLERWFTDYLEESPSAVVVTDSDGRVTHLNAAAEAVTVWPRGEAVGRPVGEIVRLASRATGASVVAEADDEGPTVLLARDTVLVDRDNQRLPADVTVSRLRDEAHRPTGTVMVLRDISGMRHGSAAMLVSDVTLAVAEGLTLDGMLQLCVDSLVRHLDAVGAGVWTLTMPGDMLVLRASAGPCAEAMASHTHVPFGSVGVGLVATERAPYLSNDAQVDPRAGDVEWAVTHGVTAFAGYPLLVDGRLVGVVAVYANAALPVRISTALAGIAPTIAVGIERKRLEEQLRQGQRLEAIGRLAGGIAHDFNNLLTVIAGCSEVLLDGPSLDDAARGLVHDISRAGDKASALTRQLLVFSRRQPVDTQLVDLAALVQHTERMLRRLIGEDIILATATNEPATVMADPGQIEQVLMNLAANARDAMPDGGRLLIETSTLTLDQPLETSPVVIAPGRYAVLSVSDTGLGMTPDVVARAFEPFYTTKPAGQGTGLGLPTVYGIVKQAGGHVTLYSEPGLGTMVRVYLPLSGDVAAAPPPAERRATASMPRGTETILLVEDDASLRGLARHILERCGYTVLEAGQGAEALRLARDHQGPIALLITDVVMPLMSGPHLARALTESRPDLRVLFISGYTDEAVSRHGAIEANAAFLRKPFVPSALATRVRDVIDAPLPDSEP